MCWAYAQVPGRPIAQQVQDGPKREGGFGGGIDDFRRHAGLHAAGRQTVALEFTQLPHEHALRYVRQRAAQLVKSMRTGTQAPQQEPLPASAEQVEGRLDGTASRLDAVSVIQRC